MNAFLPRFCAALLLGLISISASAQVFKCVDPAGKLTYQSKPCPEKSKSIELAIRDTAAVPTLDGKMPLPLLKEEMQKQCMARGRVDPELAQLIKDRPGKLQSFCQCAADTALGDANLVSQLMAKRDQDGMRNLGIRAGIQCVGKLK